MDKPIVVQAVAFMAPVHPVNNNELKFFIFGRWADHPGSLVVLDGTGTKGRPWLYCQIHNFVYPIKGFCQICETLIQEAPKDAGVTTCNTTN